LSFIINNFKNQAVEAGGGWRQVLLDLLVQAIWYTEITMQRRRGVARKLRKGTMNKTGRVTEIPQRVQEAEQFVMCFCLYY